MCTENALCCVFDYDASCFALAQDLCDICIGVSTTGNCCEETPGTPGCDNGEAAVIHQVVIQGMQYLPTSLVIKAGDSVVWTNLDDLPHTVTAKDGSYASGFMANGAEFKHTFHSVGSGKSIYTCDFHTGMEGEVIVQGSCEGCVYDNSPVLNDGSNYCFDVSYDATCVAIAQTTCKDACFCE